MFVIYVLSVFLGLFGRQLLPENNTKLLKKVIKSI
jgi:hypothetical protein